MGVGSFMSFRADLSTPDAPPAAGARPPVRLCDLRVGDSARLHRTEVDVATAQFLRAIGLTHASEIRLCKNGDPCIIQVRSTRIGLSRAVARRVFVVPISEPPDDQ
jgi:Fe2+ transport system protein FeoA